MLVASVVANLLALALPVAMLQIYDRVIPRQGLETLTALAVGLAAAVVLEMVLRTARAHIMCQAGAAYERRINRQIFRSLLAADLSFIERESPGACLDRISGIDRIREFRSGDAATAILDLPFCALYLVVIAYISPVVALALVGLMVVAVTVTRNLQSGLEPLAEKRADIDRRRYAFLLEVLRASESIKSMGIEGFMERRYERLIGTSAEAGTKVVARTNYAQAVGGAIGQVVPVFVAGIGSVLVINGSITVGALAAMILLGGRSVQPVLKLQALKVADRETGMAEKEIDQILSTPPAVRGNAALQRIDRLTLHDLHYRPAEQAPTLFEGLNLDIRRGETIAISGANGSGKTALMWLMMGEMRPQSGQVLINGADISSYQLAATRARISYLPQRPVLLEGTVLENMTRFQPELYIGEAIKVAAELGLDGYFARHPEGLSIRVSPGLPTGLPPAVAERVPLVAALIGNPDLILFDEANSSLDFEADQRLKAYLEARRGATTIVMVTQRPSYQALADRRLRIEGRRLAEVRDVLASPAAGPAAGTMPSAAGSGGAS